MGFDDILNQEDMVTVTAWRDYGTYVMKTSQRKNKKTKKKRLRA